VFSPTHLALPSLSPARSTTSMVESDSGESNRIGSMMGSIIGSFSDAPPAFLLVSEQQSDLARLTNTLRAVVEANERCWRGDECELSNGVRMGLEQLALHTQRHSEMSEGRVCLVPCI
jgi:sorting nexin-8